MTSETASFPRLLAVITLLAIVFGFVARVYLARYALAPQAVVGIYSCFMLLLVLMLLPSTSLAARMHPALYTGLDFARYLLYAAGTGDFRAEALLRLAAAPLLFFLVYMLAPVRSLEQFVSQDAVVAIGLIAIVLGHGLAGIWNVPVNLDFLGRMYLVAVAACAWTFLRPVPGLGYQFVSQKRVWRAAGLNFLFFATLAIPLSLALGFTSWNPQWRGPGKFCLDFLEIFLFIALLEELFFRGFLQNLLSRSLGSPWKGQLVAALVFGAFHILHAPVPNWRYVALASLAGWFYGSAFRSGGGLLASSLTHAAVDTGWRTWFGRA